MYNNNYDTIRIDTYREKKMKERKGQIDYGHVTTLE